MATVNVIRSNPDKFYRYKMPVMNTKIEGRGNGIKTVIPNIEDVARALARPPTYPTKFFGCELGAQTTMAEDRYIVNGAHTQERLLELLDAFIVKFVLCGACENPETELVITGKGRNELIHRDCKACGRTTKIDMKHKLTTYILKNPPAKKGSKGKKGMTAEANVGGPMVMDAEDDGETSPAETPDMGVPTKGTDIDDALGRGTDPVIDNPDAAEEVSKKLSAMAVNGDDDEDEDGDSPYATLGAWLAENKDASDADIINQIKENDIVGKHKVLIEIGSNLFTENVGAEITKRSHLLSALVTSEKHQKSLLGGIERLIANSPNMESLIAGGITSKALMALYQADLLDEELAKQWGTHASKKYVDKDKSKKIRKGSDAFLKWLDEADDESEEESDEE